MTSVQSDFAKSYYVYKPLIKAVGGHRVILDDVGNRIISAVPDQVTTLLRDYPIVGTVIWDSLSNKERLRINELCGGRIIPHELFAGDLNISEVNIPELPLSLITDLLMYPKLFSFPAPVLDEPAIEQMHYLVATSLLVGAVSFETPYVNRDTLYATSFAVSSPVISNGAMGQKYILYANWKLAVGSPVIGKGIYYVDVVAEDFSVNSPVVPVGSFVVSLAASDFVNSSPSLRTPLALLKKVLSTDGLVISSPVIGVGKSPTTVYSLSLTSDGVDRTNDTIITFIPASLLADGSGSQIRVTFKPGSTANSAIAEAWVGHSSVSGDPYDFDGNQVKLTFGGNNGASYVAGSDVVSDWVNFIYDGTKNLVVRYYFGAGSLAIVRYAAQTGTYYYYVLEANQSAPTDITAGGYIANRNNGISKVEVIT